MTIIRAVSTSVIRIVLLLFLVCLVGKQPLAIENYDFPRLGNYTGTYYPASEVSRFDLLVSYCLGDTARERSRNLKDLNPAATLLAYFLIEETASDTLDYYGEEIYPGWWLVRPGTTLSENLDATSTVLIVADPSRLRVWDDILVDNEHMHVESISGNEVAVKRACGSPPSPAASHSVSTKVSVHVSIWTRDDGVRHWMLNNSVYCPRDPQGRRWIDFLLECILENILPDPIWDGVFFDQCHDDISWIQEGNTDADGNDLADGGVGWGEGVAELVDRIRAAAPPDFMILRNNMSCECNELYNGGMEEHFSSLEPYHGGYYQLGRWAYLMRWYFNWEAESRAPRAVLINATTFNTGSIDLREMRMGLASALMEGAFYGYDVGSQHHGQPYWFDEFSVGPCGWPTQDATCKGYLGQPLAPAYNAEDPNVTLAEALETGIPDPETCVWRRDFEHGCALVNADSVTRTVNLRGEYRKIQGVQDPTVNDGSLISHVTIDSFDGIILLAPNMHCENLPPHADAGPDQYISKSGVLFYDDFEDGAESDWLYNPESQWSVVLDGDDHVLEGRPPRAWAGINRVVGDLSYRARMRLMEGDGRVNSQFREANCEHYVVNFEIYGTGLSKGNYCVGDYTCLKYQNEEHSFGEWHVLEVVAIGSTIRVFVDQQQKIEYVDPSPLPEGTISFWTADTRFYLNNVLIGVPAQLSAACSSDPNPGDQLEFSWEFLSKPLTSMAALSDPSQRDPTFIPDVPGTYRLQLTVRDILGAQDTDEVFAYVGVSSPAVFKVTRNGDVRSNGAYYGQSFETGAADVAEWVPVSEEVEPGDVLELDPDNPGHYRKSRGPCSTLVAGVVSTEPGVVLGTGEDVEGKALLALLGIVPVKVTDEGGPIQPGDLLVTSSTPGYAMRWDPDVGSPCNLVGKALEPLDGSSGIILVLLTAH